MDSDISTNDLRKSRTPTTTAADSDVSANILRKSRTPTTTTTNSDISANILRKSKLPTTTIDSDVFTNSFIKNQNNDQNKNQKQTTKKSVKFKNMNITSWPNQRQNREIIIDSNSDESGSSLNGKYSLNINDFLFFFLNNTNNFFYYIFQML